MHLRKLLTRSISFLCVLMLLVSVTPSAFAGLNSGSLNNSNIKLSVTDENGTSGGGNTEKDRVSSNWTPSGAAISGSVTPGYTTKYIFLQGTKKYADKAAKSHLTIQNGLTEDAELVFYYTKTGNSAGNVSFSCESGYTDDGKMVKTVLGAGKTLTITLTTASTTSVDVPNTDYTVGVNITGLALASLTADLNITLGATSGGSYTVSDGTETKGPGGSFTNPKDTKYTLTAVPDQYYHFEGWFVDGGCVSTSPTETDFSFGGDGVLEARFSKDVIFDIATVTGDETGTVKKEDLVEINSRYIHQTNNELKEQKQTANNQYGYYSVTTKQETSYFDTQYVPSLQWTKSGTTAVVGASGTATGEWENTARSWAYANMVADVIQIYAKEDCIIEFTYSGSVPEPYSSTVLGKETERVESATGVRIYESTSGTASLGTIFSGSTVYTGASNTLKVSLQQGRYLYVLTNGYSSKGQVLVGSGSAALNYHYNGTISDVKITPNDTKYVQTTTFKDNMGNVLKNGKLTLNAVSYTSNDDGKISIATMPDGQAMKITSVTPPANYAFFGWEVNGEMHYTSTYEYVLNANTTVNPVFVPKNVTYSAADGTYQYKNVSGTVVDLNGQYIARNNAYTEFYTSLADAFSKTNEVVLLGNLTINGDFEIPDGKVLVVPGYMNDAVNKDSSGIYNPYATTKIIGSGAYATLTMNGNLTVNGALIVSGQQVAANGGPGGSYGVVTVPTGYTVTVSENKALYGYGLINGAGEIVVKNGAKVHELCEVRDIPHPMLMSDMVMSNSGKQIMPFNSFYINTIEAKTTYEYGASLYGHLSLSYDSITQSSFPAIAPSGSILVVNSGTVTKYYDSAIGKISFRVNEGSSVESGAFTANMTVHLGGEVSAELESKKFYVPMSVGYQFVIAGDLTMKHDFKMLPGCKVNVLRSGKLTIAKDADLVFYRLNDYDYRKPGSDTEEGIGFSVAGYPVNITRHSGFSVSNIGSAHLNVDGEVIVLGGLYVTEAPIDNRTETEMTYKTYKQYDNGFNILTGTGRVDVSDAQNNKTEIYEHQHKYNLRSTNAVEVKIVPIKGLTAEATADSPDQYVSLTGVSKGMTNGAGLNVWSADPCAAGHNMTENAAVAATCVTAGTKAYWTCKTCGDSFSDEACTFVIADLEAWLTDETENGGMIAALGHTYGKTEYNWAEDYTTCSAVRTCTVEGCTEEIEGHTETAEATITSEVTKAATCKEAGERTYTAAFADDKSWAEQQTKTEVIAVDENGHDWDTATYAWADDGQNCTATRVCKLDNTHKETAEATVNTQIVNATCSTAGSTTYTATFEVAWAEAQDKTETTDKLSHTAAAAVQENVVAATCGKAGSYDNVVKCSVCNKELSRTKVDVPATGNHTYDAGTVTKEATCKETGVKTYTCTGCGNTKTETIAKLTTHTEVTDAAVAPTCTATGLTEGKHCDVCGEVITAQKEIPALGHDMKETAAAVAPTCEAAGKTAVLTCANGCGKTEGGAAVAALGHDYALTDSKNATCTEDGYETYTCKNDKNHTYTNVLTKNGHTSGEAEVENNVPPSCGVAGSYDSVVKCTVCGAELSRNTVTVEATGNHNYTVEQSRVEPTCVAEGSVTKKCAKCDATTTETLPIDGNNHTGKNHIVNEKPADCTTAGYTGDTVCECGVTVKQGEETKALGHKYTNYKSNNDATCTADGTKTALCDNGCGKTDTIADTGSKLAHDWNDATCTAPKTCKNCSVTEGKANGHTWVDATYEAPKTCSVCGATEGEALTGHNVSIDVIAGSTASDPQIQLRNGTIAGEGWNNGGTVIAGETVDFSVSHDKACVVIVIGEDEQGNTTYSKLTATKTDDVNTYNFSTAAVDDMEIVVAVKGDLTGDGNVDGFDKSRLAYATLPPFNSNYDPFTGVYSVIADMTADGNVNGFDKSRLAYATLPPFNKNCDPFVW